MKEVQLTRSFLKKPFNSVVLLIGLLLIVEGLAWTIAYNAKMVVVDRYGGLLPYILIILRSYIIPEIFTAVILSILINKHHKWLKIKNIELDFKNITRYELSILPVVLFSFLLFNPVTQTTRYILEAFPSYSFPDYWSNFLYGTFRWDIYFRYLAPVFVVSYLLVNISFISDYLKQRQQAQEKVEAEAAETMQKALALSATFIPKPTVPSPYLGYIKGKNTHGELDFPVNDVYYFTIVDRFYYAEMIKGRYLVAKTLNDLEAELDPNQFFRIKRDYIVNRQAVLSYAYWENGKYIVRLNTPDRYEIIVPRARMQEFREWLQGNQQPYADSDTDPYVLTS